MSSLRLPTSLFVILGAALIFAGVALRAVSAQQETPVLTTISGVVTNEEGVVPNATLQIQGSPTVYQADARGLFIIPDVDLSAPVVLTAWSEGHYIGWASVDPSSAEWSGGTGITVSLRALPGYDHNDYEWFVTEDGVQGSAGCGECHREYPEWQADQHSRAATNERFLTVYTGEDVHGNQGQLTRYGLVGGLPPDPEKPYYGPGFILDNPGRAGNCATCHTPAARNTPNTQNCAWSGCHTNLTIERSRGVIDPAVLPINLTGDGAEGISCEFCHVISNVLINPETGLPYADMPGILSLQLQRAGDPSERVFFGTLLDVQSTADSYSSLLSESTFCAGCHYGVFGGVVGMDTVTGGTTIYNSYGEWLESPYSDPETGSTCQDCHMPVSNSNWTVRASRGGITREHSELHDHTMLGATNEEFLQNTVTLTTSAEDAGDQMRVQVSITNDRAGHHVPTDSPIRSMILVVEALDADGNPLTLVDGSVNPDFSGEYAGIPGRTFAKVLRDDWTGEFPTAAIWRPTTILEDTRIPALATDTTDYTFALPSSGGVTINVRLIYRRAFALLAEQKGWTDADILMEQETIHFP